MPKLNLIGNKYNRLLVIREAGKGNGNEVLWECKCDCGNVGVFSGHSIKRGHTKSCGCLNDEMRKIGKLKEDLSSLKFGRLSVVGRAGKSKSGAILWECLCECGTKKIVYSANLKRGLTKSCGCLQKESVKMLFKTHGHGSTNEKYRSTSEYTSWQQMKARCINPENPDYHRYGGIGIMVCDRWLNSFENFFADMGIKPSPDHSLDRFPNNKGNYEPENCRWATQIEQQQNRGNNRWLEYNGEKKIIIEWARYFGVTHSAINSYIKKYGETEMFEHFNKKVNAA